MSNEQQTGNTAKPEPQLGDYAVARRADYGDYRDEEKDEGVIVGKPTGRDGYYRLLSPHDQTEPFEGHVDDIEVVPADELTGYAKRFHERVREMLNADNK